MSDEIKHECGIALVRLLKPLEFYKQKYNTVFYGISKLHLLMQKQHNRGQDGAGIASIKFDTEPGQKYIQRIRALGSNSIREIFDQVYEPLKEVDPLVYNDIEWLKHNFDYSAELFLGHLRYGTFGNNNIDYCHPFIRGNNWKTKNLVLAGNFNMTNVDELFDILVNIGQHPKEKSDTVTVLEKIGHYMDEENETLFQQYKKEGKTYKEISELIAQHISLTRILKNSAQDFDGGYAMAGLIGHGDAFIFRDPNGIRPAFYYQDDEVVVVASERPAIQTAFGVEAADIHEVIPGNALIIKKNGRILSEEILPAKEKKSCSFERIYFSRGTDQDIYEERKNLGRFLAPVVLGAINHDLENTVFSFIPNTAEVCFYGLLKGVEDHLRNTKLERIKKASSDEEIQKIISDRPRVEKIAVKDMKLRTFITEDSSRDDLVTHIYDVTYGAVRKGIDTLVVIDDSIVRGTTLKTSIIRMLDRLGPKKIIVVSSAPQIRYPDCYGIDMAKLGDFIAFQAAVALLKETKQEHILQEVYQKCIEQNKGLQKNVTNYVAEIYKPFSDEALSKKIAQLVKAEGVKAEVEVIYQNVDNLHKAIPKHSGDWYFTGNYPTPGGIRVVNKAFMNYMEGKNIRAY
jgi:amidophosphoribosyltransferase